MVISFVRLVLVWKAFAFQHGGFVPREWLATKGVLVVDALLEFNQKKIPFTWSGDLSNLEAFCLVAQ